MTAAVMPLALPLLASGPRSYVVGAKNFSEQFILAELISGRLASQSVAVERKEGLGSAVALRAIGARDAADAAWAKAQTIVDILGAARPIEAAVVRAQMLAIDGRLSEADDVLCHALHGAPPGFGGWTIPVEPFLPQPAATTRLTGSLRRLSERAR